MFREPGDDEEARAPTRTATARLLTGIYRKADAAYAPYSCAVSGECCQLATTRRQPWLWLPEWQAIEDRLRRDDRSMPPPRADGACPFLDASGKRCSIYADRPFGCRTFFCSRIRGPSREPAEAVAELLGELEALSRRVAPEVTAPRPLLSWWEQAR